MKIADVFPTSGHTASYKLGRMILPQLERGRTRSSRWNVLSGRVRGVAGEPPDRVVTL